MKNKLLIVAFILTLALGVGIGHFTNLPTVEAQRSSGTGDVVDPVLIVHQGVNGGPISVYKSHDPSVVALIQQTPDNGCSPNGDTCYIEGSPYLTNSVTTVTDQLYIGLNNPAPPAH